MLAHLLGAQATLASHVHLQVPQLRLVLLDSGMALVLDQEALREGVELPVLAADAPGQKADHLLPHLLHSLGTCN